MTTDNNKAVMLRYIEAVNKGDFAAAEGLVDAANYVEHNPAWGALDYAGAQQVYATLGMALPDLHFEPDVDLMVAEGDKVVTRGVVSGTHTGAELFGVPASGKRVTWVGIDISRIANGKIVERWLVADILSLMQQVGAIPAPGQAAGSG